MNPEWWASYNNVKHHRLDSYAEANLGNVLRALSGLFVPLSCLYRYEHEHGVDEVPRYLPVPKRLAFSSRGIEIGSSELMYVIGTALCSPPGFHVDMALQLLSSDERDGGADSYSDLFGPPICPHSPIGKATVMVVTYDSATISCHLYGDIKSYVIIYLRKQRAT